MKFGIQSINRMHILNYLLNYILEIISQYFAGAFDLQFKFINLILFASTLAFVQAEEYHARIFRITIIRYQVKQ